MALTVVCTETAPPTSSTPTHRIVFLFDGSTDDADEVTGPALGGLKLAALRSGNVEVVPVDLGGDPRHAIEVLHAVGDDRGVVAAVVAPWTPAPDAGADVLASAGVPVVSLSWDWATPADPAVAWRSLTLTPAGEASSLLNAGADLGPGALCVAGDTTTMGVELSDRIVESRLPGVTISDAGVVDPGRPATASAVAGRISRARCEVLLWTGGVEAATSLMEAQPRPGPVVGTSRMKTDDGVLLAADTGTALVTVCGCVDVNLSLREPDQRFVHDFQAENAAPPGPFAAEAFDIGRSLIGLLGAGGGTRAGLAVQFGRIVGLDGMAERYRFEPDGSRTEGTVPEGRWRASGSRWLPAGGTGA